MKALPPGFKPFDPEKPITCYVRRLPHWRQEGASYFVTFRFGDALPAQVAKRLQTSRSKLMAQAEQLGEEKLEAALRILRIEEEHILDEGYGACWFKQRAYRDAAERALCYFQGERLDMNTYTIMPNHIHAVLKPHDGYQLETLLGSMKKAVTREIHAKEKLSGSLWQEESYDRIIRDGEHLLRCLKYIGDNGTNAGLSERTVTRWVDPVWAECGWSF